MLLPPCQVKSRRPNCPLPPARVVFRCRPVIWKKDCTLEQLGERFETVRRVGGDEVWLAEPNEVVQYILSEGTDS